MRNGVRGRNSGPSEVLIDVCRDAMPLAWLDSVGRNFHLAVRSFRRYPSLVLTVILTLALGISTGTAIATVDYATLIAPLPYPQPNHLVMVWVANS